MNECQSKCDWKWEVRWAPAAVTHRDNHLVQRSDASMEKAVVRARVDNPPAFLVMHVGRLSRSALGDTSRHAGAAYDVHGVPCAIESEVQLESGFRLRPAEMPSAAKPVAIRSRLTKLFSWRGEPQSDCAPVPGKRSPTRQRFSDGVLSGQPSSISFSSPS